MAGADPPMCPSPAGSGANSLSQFLPSPCDNYTRKRAKLSWSTTPESNSWERVKKGKHCIVQINYQLSVVVLILLSCGMGVWVFLIELIPSCSDYLCTTVIDLRDVTSQVLSSDKFLQLVCGYLLHCGASGKNRVGRDYIWASRFFGKLTKLAIIFCMRIGQYKSSGGLWGTG